jgi:hypothetical protein
MAVAAPCPWSVRTPPTSSRSLLGSCCPVLAVSTRLTRGVYGGQWVDWDLDGDLDFLFCNATGANLAVNDGRCGFHYEPFWLNVDANCSLVTVGDFGKPQLTLLDGDMDPDAILGGARPSAFLLTNRAVNPAFRVRVLSLAGSSYSSTLILHRLGSNYTLRYG